MISCISTIWVKYILIDSLKNLLGLSPFFKSALESLPSTYDSFAYKSLINDFGTHFRKRITLGGKLNQLAFTDSEYTKKYSLDSISRQAGASFYVSVSASSTHESEITQEFKQSTSLTQIEAIGGSPWVSGADSWAAWASSIPGKPEVIYQVSEIKRIKKIKFSSTFLLHI